MNAHKPAKREEVVRNATSAERSATSLVPALNLRALEVTTAIATVVVVVVRPTALLEAEAKKPGMIVHRFLY